MVDPRRGSEHLSREFYRRLGPDGLAKRTRPELDADIVAALVELLPEGARVLDVGCGYGRIAVPLARIGYRVEGLDLSPDLIEAARERARAARVDVPFRVGSMTELPYRDASFDAVICLWSAFNELLTESEQVAALRELWRVTAEDGFVLIEGRPYSEPTDEEIRAGTRRGSENRIDWDYVEGLLNPHYRHDQRSFARLCCAAGLDCYEVFERDWGGRERLFLRLDRQAAPDHQAG